MTHPEFNIWDASNQRFLPCLRFVPAGGYLDFEWALKELKKAFFLNY